MDYIGTPINVLIVKMSLIVGGERNARVGGVGEGNTE